MTFTDWLTSSIGTTAILGIIGFLARHWIIDRLSNAIKHEYDKKIETHKADLIRQNDLELSNFKHNLELAAMERHVRYSLMFEKKAQIIAEVYVKIVDLDEAIQDARVKLSQPQETAAYKSANLEVAEKIEDFRAYFRRNKIYIPPPTAQLLWDYRSMLSQQHLIFINIKDMKRRGEKVDQDMLNSLKNTYIEIPPMLKALESDLQNILGVQEGIVARDSIS